MAFYFNHIFMTQLLYKEEVYAIVGFCMEVKRILGYGFSEVIYKDAIEEEFLENGLAFIREDELSVNYKGKILKHKFKADFTLINNIILEVKSGEDGIIDKSISQTLNYLRASGCKIGLIVNFGKTRLEYKRLIV